MNEKGRYHLKDLEVIRRILLKRNLKKYVAGVNWI
jgi:hypothetical protein